MKRHWIGARPCRLRHSHNPRKLPMEGPHVPQNRSTGGGLPFDWSAMLDKVQEALRVAEAEARQREQAYPSASPAPASDGGLAAKRASNTERLEEALCAMQARLHEQELKIHAMESALGADEDMLRKWLITAQAVPRNLANWGSAEV
jgi:hypothetical protein